MIRQYFSTSQPETWSLQWVNDQILIRSFFCTKRDYYKYCSVGWKKWAQFSGRRISARERKSHNNAISNFFKSTVHLLTKDLRFEHGGVKLVSCLGRHLTSLHPCTSPLSTKNGEICLQKYLPISCKLSITNYLQKMLLIVKVIWP